MYLFFLLFKYKPIKLFIMKNVLLFALVAFATTGYSQDASVPNVKIKTDSYRSYETVDYLYTDSTWFPFDSLIMALNKFTQDLYNFDELFGPDTTTGYYFYDMEPVERFAGFTKSKETFDFNFTDSTLTRVVNGKRFTDNIVGYYINYDVYDLENENPPLRVFVITEDGYDRNYDVNFNDGTLEYDVKSIDATNVFGTFNRRTHVVEFKKY